MVYAILGILVVAFVALVVLSAKSWHWSDILFLILVFLTGLGGLIAMSRVLELRRKAMIEVQRVEKELIQVQQETELVLNGPEGTFEYGSESLRGLSEALNLETAGRGRVWRGGQIESKEANRVFNFAADRVQNPENPASMMGMLMFIFSDQQLGGEVYPVSFVGTMRVIGETPSSVEMEPVFIANTEEYATPSATWTLYEKPPSDFHEVYFRTTGVGELNPDDEQLNQKLTQYRAILETEYLPAGMFGLDINDPQQALQYEGIIDRVLFDGLPLVKIENWVEAQANRVSPRFDPPGDSIFVRYRFEEKSNRSYQVDSTGNISNDGQFTASGQAVDPALHAGAEIEFQKGDEILVDQLTADGYQREGEPVPPFPATEPVTEVSRFYVRQLRDYPYLLSNLRRKQDDNESEIARHASNNLKSQKAIQDTETQINQRAELNEKLTQDRSRLQADVAVVKSYADKLRLQKADLEMQLRAVESEIRDQHRQLKGMAQALKSIRGNQPNSLEAAPGFPPQGFEGGVLFDPQAPAGDVQLPTVNIR
jgi:hypothetical protein